MSARSLPHSMPNSIFKRTFVRMPTGEDLNDVTMVYDGSTTRHPGNFIGVYGAIENPAANQRGNFWWYAAGGDHGDCHTEEEAQKEIADTWYGAPGEGNFNPK